MLVRSKLVVERLRHAGELTGGVFTRRLTSPLFSGPWTSPFAILPDHSAVSGLVQHVRIEIDSVRPNDSPGLVIDCHTIEEGRILQRRKDAAPAADP